MGNYKNMKKAELVEECERMDAKLRATNMATLNDLNKYRDEALALRNKVDKLEDALSVTGEARMEVKRLTDELAYAEQQIEGKDEEIGKLESKLDDITHDQEGKLYGTIEAMETAVDLCRALLPGYESPDESLAVYDARRALDDLSYTARKLNS
jgi:predicted RNase H-like nuclease (RuvC/YqgF family)